VKIYATKGTAAFLRGNGLETTMLHWPLEDSSPNVLEFLNSRKIDLVINIPKNYQREELTNDYLIRRKAVDFGIPLITNIQLAERFVQSLARRQISRLDAKPYSAYVR
jgi:carbamoyl-phosphate synthase large subunit